MRLRGLVDRVAGFVAVFLVRAYQVGLSPAMGGQCRFAPSCSEYAVQAIERHGPWTGVRLAVARVLRCHPFHPGGLDPVPAAEERHGS